MEEIKKISISRIVTGDNDRTTFDDKSLKELAENIKDRGLVEPIILRRTGKVLKLVAGERRLRACILAGLKKIPSVIKSLSEESASAIMLAENVSRKDLDPIDEGAAYQKRIDRFGWTVEAVAKNAGTTTVHVRFRLKLLKLIPELQQLVRGNNLQLGYAQILSDADLDSNFQILAFSKFRDNPNPTPGWFRNIVDDLKQKQNQGILFKGPLFDGSYDSPDIQKKEIIEPPHPSSATPPKNGRTLHEVILNQKSFWEEAANQWDHLGKPFKRNDCKSAALALNLAIS
jgi:ParB/RepB/Spo0J family partition protein